MYDPFYISARFSAACVGQYGSAAPSDRAVICAVDDVWVAGHNSFLGAFTK